MTHDRFAERRRTVAEDRARRALRRTTVILGMAAMIAGVVYLFHSPVLSVKTLDIEGAEHAGVDHVLASHGISIGEPLIWTDVAGATAALTDDPWVESVSVERRWPTTVNVSVAERQPVGTVGGVAVAVDGVILPNAPVEGLPVVRIEGEAVGGRYPGQEIVGALRFLSAIRPDLAAAASVASSPEGLVAVVSGYTVRLGRPVDMEEKARALGPVLDEEPPEGSEITLVAPARPSVLAPNATVPAASGDPTNPEVVDEG